MRFLNLIIFILGCFSFSVSSYADIAPIPVTNTAPKESEKSSSTMKELFPGMEMGKMTGEVYLLSNNKKQFLPNQEIALIVFQGEDEMLKLHKPTDDKGQFEFKNIFRDPKFHYIVGTFYKDKMYIYDRISLEKNQELHHVSLQVGEGSPFLLNVTPEAEKTQTKQGASTVTDQSMPFNMAESTNASHSVKGFLQEPYQKVVLALSLVVILFSAYFYWGRGQKGVSSTPLGNFDQKESDLLVLSWLREEFKKNQLPEDVFKAQEAKMLERLKQYYV